MFTWLDEGVSQHSGGWGGGGRRRGRRMFKKYVNSLGKSLSLKKWNMYRLESISLLNTSYSSFLSSKSLFESVVFNVRLVLLRRQSVKRNILVNDSHALSHNELWINALQQLFFFIRELRKWWAQYMESTSEMETALQFYEAARDNLSLVRVYCYCGNLEKVSFYRLSAVSHVLYLFHSLRR